MRDPAQPHVNPGRWRVGAVGTTATNLLPTAAPATVEELHAADEDEDETQLQFTPAQIVHVIRLALLIVENK